MATPSAPGLPPSVNHPTVKFYNHSSADRVNTDATLYQAVRRAHPKSQVTVIPEWSSPFKAYAQSTTGAQSGVTLTPVSQDSTLAWLIYVPPARRLDSSKGALGTETFYEIYLMRHAGHEFLVYFVDGRDGTMSYPATRNQYVVHAGDDHGGTSLGVLHQLARDAGTWLHALHEEIWVFDQGWWQKDASLYANIARARWSDVILHADLKVSLISTVTRFFDSREDYARLGVPWKRGLIFHGPPGNGKTISIKATMHTLYRRRPVPVPTLYVKSLTSFGGPEYSISAIFARARAEAPCYLVFEDLDSMVTDEVRSFFLNAVDGLGLNEGVLMVGSTNHLDRLDPGIAKRPSRFDRKYLFDDPDEALRERYALFWRGKVLGKKKKKEEEVGGGGGGQHSVEGEHEGDDDGMKIEFPKFLCGKIAGITDGFSFAYMQEAFLATLLAIANGSQEQEQGLLWWSGGEGGERASVNADLGVEGLGERWELLDLEEEDGGIVGTRKEKGGGGGGGDGDGDGDDDDDDDLDKYALWREMKKQVQNLREEMGKDKSREE